MVTVKRDIGRGRLLYADNSIGVVNKELLDTIFDVLRLPIILLNLNSVSCKLSCCCCVQYTHFVTLRVAFVKPGLLPSSGSHCVHLFLKLHHFLYYHPPGIMVYLCSNILISIWRD